MLIIAHFAPLSTEFLKKIKVFRFGNSCALCARLPRQLRVCVSCARRCVLRAYQSSRATFRGGLMCPRWARFVRPFLGRFLPPFWVGVFGLLFGCGWVCVWVVFGGVLGWCVGGVGERERQRRTGKGERAQGRTAHGLRVSACLPLVSVSALVSVRQILSF